MNNKEDSIKGIKQTHVETPNKKVTFILENIIKTELINLTNTQQANKGTWRITITFKDNSALDIFGEPDLYHWYEKLKQRLKVETL